MHSRHILFNKKLKFSLSVQSVLGRRRKGDEEEEDAVALQSEPQLSLYLLFMCCLSIKQSRNSNNQCWPTHTRTATTLQHVSHRLQTVRNLTELREKLLTETKATPERNTLHCDMTVQTGTSCVRTKRSITNSDGNQLHCPDKLLDDRTIDRCMNWLTGWLTVCVDEPVVGLPVLLSQCDEHLVGAVQLLSVLHPHDVRLRHALNRTAQPSRVPLRHRLIGRVLCEQHTCSKDKKRLNHRRRRGRAYVTERAPQLTQWKIKHKIIVYSLTLTSSSVFISLSDWICA